VMNENYTHPAMPSGIEDDIVSGMYLFDSAPNAQVQLLGSGTILREVIAAAELLQADFGIASNIWSVTSFNELRREGLECSRWNMLHPVDPPRVSFVGQQLGKHNGPCVAATDYIRAYAGQIREYVPHRYRVLGTDGFGRSDSRSKLREYFEVNRYYVAVAALKALADDGDIEPQRVADAIEKYGIDADKPNPMNCLPQDP